MDRELLNQKIEETVIDGTEREIFEEAIKCALRVGRTESSPLPDYLNLVLACEELSELQQVLLDRSKRSLDYDNMAEEIVDVRFCLRLVKDIFNIEYSDEELIRTYHFEGIDQACAELAKLQQCLTKAIRGKDVSDIIAERVLVVEKYLVMLTDPRMISEDTLEKISKIKCLRCIERSKQNIL